MSTTSSSASDSSDITSSSFANLSTSVIILLSLGFALPILFLAIACPLARQKEKKHLMKNKMYNRWPDVTQPFSSQWQNVNSEIQSYETRQKSPRTKTNKQVNFEEQLTVNNNQLTVNNNQLTVNNYQTNNAINYPSKQINNTFTTSPEIDKYKITSKSTNLSFTSLPSTSAEGTSDVVEYGFTNRGLIEENNNIKIADTSSHLSYEEKIALSYFDEIYDEDSKKDGGNLKGIIINYSSFKKYLPKTMTIKKTDGPTMFVTRL